MHILHQDRDKFKQSLDGYDRELETMRDTKIELFWSAKDCAEARSALRGHASLTSLRSSTFVTSYDLALGIGVHNE